MNLAACHRQNTKFELNLRGIGLLLRVNSTVERKKNC